MTEPLAVVCEMGQRIIDWTAQQILAVIQAGWFIHSHLLNAQGMRQSMKFKDLNPWPLSLLRKSYDNQNLTYSVSRGIISISTSGV